MYTIIITYNPLWRRFVIIPIKMSIMAIYCMLAFLVVIPAAMAFVYEWMKTKVSIEFKERC